MSNTTASDLHLCAADLRALASQLSDRQLARALRNTLRKRARSLRRTAQAALRSTGIHYTRGLAQTLRADMSRDARGIYATVRASKRTGAGMHKRTRSAQPRLGSAKPQLKPVLLWAADGTAERTTLGGMRRAHRTGRMPRERFGGFMEKAERTEGPGFERAVRAELDAQLEKQIRKYGFI